MGVCGKCGIEFCGYDNFCSYCGNIVGTTPKMKFLKEIREYLNDNSINLANVEAYKGTIAWMMAKERTLAFSELDDDEISRRLK